MFPSPLLALAQVVLAEAREKKLRLATAESCTGGLIAGLLTEIPGSSDVLDRGFVVYSNPAKSAAHMAIAVTGVAGPGGGTALKPVGLVHIAAARERRSILHEAHRFGDIGRREIRLKSVEAALLLLQRILSS